MNPRRDWREVIEWTLALAGVAGWAVWLVWWPL